MSKRYAWAKPEYVVTMPLDLLLKYTNDEDDNEAPDHSAQLASIISEYNNGTKGS